MIRSATISSTFACALALTSMVAAPTAGASDRDSQRPNQLQTRAEHGSAAGQHHWLGGVFANPFGVIPGGHDYRRGHDHHSHGRHDDHLYSGSNDHHGYDRHGYRDYDRDSDSGHHARHDYRHQGYYCARCHYRTPSRHIFFNHLHLHHHIPWYKAVSYLVWSPVHLVFVFD